MKRTRSGHCKPGASIVIKKYEQNIPTPGDEIKVLWKINDKTVCWRASVLEVTAVNAPPVVARGVLDYEAYQNYSQEVTEVEFILLNGDQCLVKQFGVNAVELDTNTWLHAAEATLSTDEIHTLDEHFSANSDEDDEGAGGRRCKNSKLAEDDRVTERISMLEHTVSLMQQDVDQIRKSETSLTEVFELRNELIFKRGSRWPFSREIWTFKGEDTFFHNIEATVGCSLRAMRSIAVHIQRNLRPSSLVSTTRFHEVEACSLAIQKISVDVATLRELCDVLFINDGADYAKMLW